MKETKLMISSFVNAEEFVFAGSSIKSVLRLR